MARLAHISDLHFPARAQKQVEALRASILESRPDALIVTGDHTRRGRSAEFELARAFLLSLPVETLIVPGNHDIPLFGFALPGEGPFGRYDRFLGELSAATILKEGVAVIGLNTAGAAQARLDWSLGVAKTQRIDETVRLLAEVPQGHLRLVACHHPLLPNAHDLIRSRTLNGPAAFRRLAGAGMDGLLHGHLHWAKTIFAPYEDREIHIIGAGPGLSDRERGSGSGYNLIDIASGALEVLQMVWDGTAFRPISEASLGIER